MINFIIIDFYFGLTSIKENEFDWSDTHEIYKVKNLNPKTFSVLPLEKHIIFILSLYLIVLDLFTFHLNC